MIVEKQITQRNKLSDLNDPSLRPLLNRLYANRGVKSTTELDYTLKNLPKPELLTGMSIACDILYEALMAQANIIIVGDYDVDGATSTALVMQSLQAFGFKHVAYFIPDRMAFGYGLSPKVVSLIQEYQPDLIITVDNGISSIDGIQLAHEFGISVIVTDHHLPAQTLPQADAIINPNLPGDRFPAKKMAGVGVAFYLMLGLRAHLRQLNWFADQKMREPSMVEYLDLVALGTIADVVPFDYFNRLLVDQGMQRIRHSKCAQGIKALATISQSELNQITTTDIAFKIAPRINAAGRLDDMSIGVECLLTNDSSSAVALANQLNKINEQRKTEELKSNQQAASQISADLANELQTDQQASICLHGDNWHPGIVGLVASRLKDRFNLPTVIFADDDNFIKGSARSISGVHIRDVLAAIDSRQPGLMKSFGGHAMAAGLSLEKDDLPKFKTLFDDYISTNYADKLTKAAIQTDGSLSSEDLNLQTCQLIQTSGPWGPDFELPQFDNSFEVINCKIIGKTKNHLRFELRIHEHAEVVSAVAFNVDRYFDLAEISMQRINAVYKLDINHFNGLTQLQVIIDYFNVES